jgi:hypothetical protein
MTREPGRVTIADVSEDRSPTAAELVASIIHFGRYLEFEGDAIAFWKTLRPHEQDYADYLVRAVVATLAPDPEPRCPKRCDVATRPEALARGRWLCTACGDEFTWPPSERRRRSDTPDTRLHA